MTIVFTVTHDEAGTRLDRWVRRRFPNFPQSLLEKMLRKGEMRVDGKKAQTNARVEAGQVVSFPEQDFKEFKRVDKATPQVVAASDIREVQGMVFYKDANVLALNKPSGWAVQGGSGLRVSIDGLREHLKFDAKEAPKLVHRLDRDTSGVMVLARKSASAAKFSKMLQAHDIEKTYWALVIGVPEIREGTINQPIGKAGGAYEKMEVRPEGQKAVTHYRVIEALGKSMAWVEFMPQTGRTHQIRVHAAAIGCPIVGDGKYGGKAAFAEDVAEGKLHLHARKLVVPNFFGKTLELEAPLSGHMKKTWKALGLT